MNIAVLGIFFIWILATALWWGFAFIQLPGPTPQWLLDAKAVCFGETITGLPTFKGWMTLTVPSLMLVSSLVVVFFEDLKGSLKIFLKTRSGQFLSAILLLGLCFEAYTIGQIVFERWPTENMAFERPTGLPSEYPQTTLPIEGFELIDQNKNIFSVAGFENKKSIVTFGFSNCDTICPVVIRNSIKAIEGFDAKEYQLVVISLDPWRDTPGRLKAASKVWEMPENSKYLSGTSQSVTDVLKSLNVPFSRDLKTGFVNHPALVYIVNVDGTIAYSFNNPSIRWIKEALERL